MSIQKIYKYNLDIVDCQTVEMPIGTKILSVQQQYSEIVMWAIVNTDKRMGQREIMVVGTGNPIEESLWTSEFIGTVQLDGCVWHIFDGGWR